MNEAVLSAALSLALNYYDYHLFSLAQNYTSLENLYSLVVEKSPKLDLPADSIVRLEKAWEPEQIKKVIHLLEKHKINAYSWLDAAYPSQLRLISDPPYTLYCKGNIEAVSQTCLSIVGTRQVTPYGKRATELIVKALSGRPVCIVSGLALGVDAVVHAQALAHKLPTVAVLAAGLDRYEPLTNGQLGSSVEASGCTLSEYPPTVRPQKHQFLARNRIIAGLSQATIIIEGKKHSGALVTARYALEYGRELGTVPGDIFVPNSEGPSELLREGAWSIASGEDVIQLLGLPEYNAPIPQENGPVYAILREQALPFDSLAELVDMPVAEIQMELTRLELEDCISVAANGEYYVTR